MAGKKGNGWAAVLKELKDPGDWAAACLGGAAGAGVTFGLHGLDFGHSIPTGCLTAIGLKKTWVLSRRFGKLKKRARGQLKVMHSRGRDPVLVSALDYLLERAAEDAVTYEDFEQEFKDICNKDKGIAPLPLPIPAAVVVPPPVVPPPLVVGVHVPANN